MPPPQLVQGSEIPDNELWISKINEAWIKVRASPSTAQDLSDFFTFRPPNYKYTPAYKKRKWDGAIRLYDRRTQLIYHGLLYYVVIFANKKSIDIKYQNNISTIDESNRIPEFLQDINLSIEPREYQKQAFIHAVVNNRSVLLSPTGSGKSLIIYLISRFYEDLNVLVVVPTTSLVSQMYSDFAEYSSEDVEWNVWETCHKIFSGREKETDRKITITTWQSVFRLPPIFFRKYGCVIGDEAHGFKAKSLIDVMTKCENARIRIGTTGTLDGQEVHKLVLEGLFGPVQKVITTKNLIDSKMLTPLTIKAVILRYPESDRILARRFDYRNELDFIISSKVRNLYIKNLCLSLKRNTLILFQFVERHGEILYDLISKEGGDRKIYFIHGGVVAEEREEVRRVVEKENDAIIIASVGVFSTGVNIKNLHNVVFASPSKSRVRNLQSIGRALRLSETKSMATLYDIADDLSSEDYVNFTFRHFWQRIKIYKEEGFPYKIYKVSLNLKSSLS